MAASWLLSQACAPSSITGPLLSLGHLLLVLQVPHGPPGSPLCRGSALRLSSQVLRAPSRETGRARTTRGVGVCVCVCVCVCKRACMRAASVQQSQQPGESAQLHSRLERHARRLLSQAAQAAWGEVKGRSVSKRCSWPSRSRVLGPLCRQWKGAGENWKLRGSSHMTLFLLVGSPLDSQWWESQGVGFAVGVFRWASWNVNSVRVVASWHLQVR